MILDKGQWLKKKEKFSSHKRPIKAFRLNDKFNYIEEDKFICSYIMIITAIEEELND